MNKFVYVNHDLKVVDELTQAVGVAILLKEEDITDVGCLDGLDIGQALVNIALFEPIGYNCSLLESLELQKQ